VVVSAETHEVAKGHSVTFFVARGSTVSDNSPFTHQSASKTTFLLYLTGSGAIIAA
jgi:hypothetical protein